MLNAYLVIEEFDEPRVPGGVKPDLYVGPPRQKGGPLIEVMTYTEDETLWVFHVMQAKPSRVQMTKEANGWA